MYYKKTKTKLKQQYFHQGTLEKGNNGVFEPTRQTSGLNPIKRLKDRYY